MRADGRLEWSRRRRGPLFFPPEGIFQLEEISHSHAINCLLDSDNSNAGLFQSVPDLGRADAPPIGELRDR
jgi:hypothetical protein